MIGAKPFPQLRNWQPPEKLVQAAAPVHEVLSGFVHDCAPDPATRTMASAALVLSLWQLRGHSLSEHVPSCVLLNAEEAAPDPVDDFIGALVHDEEANRPGAKGRRVGIPIQPEEAPDIMTRALQERQAISRYRHLDQFDQRNAQIHEGHYREARKSAYGSGWARAYARAWTESFGLISEDDDGLILRLTEGTDRSAFRHDVLEDPDRLLLPEGIGRHLQMSPKTISVSGSLTLDLWDEELVSGIIELGLPILFLPHTGKEPLTIPNPAAMEALPGLWRSAPGPRAKTSLMVPPIDWFEAHYQDVRRRLHLLPGTGSYQFAVLQVLHQLGDVCAQIAHYAANNTTATPKQVAALFGDLHTRTFRGITLGVAALAWHGLGFNPGCPRQKALKALKDLRTKGPLSRSEVLVGARLNKAERDLLLERLVAEDLVRVDGKTVTATTFLEFVAALHTRPGLPEADDYRKLVDGDVEPRA